MRIKFKDRELKELKKENAALKAEIKELKKLVQKQFEVIERQNKIIEEQNERIKELEAKLNLPQKDSSNSSLPPSSDKKSKRNYPSRERSGKKPGGQKGHPGHYLELSETPDEIVSKKPESCPFCGAKELTETGEIERRQEIGIEVKTVTTEHQRPQCICAGCKQKSKAAFPENLTAPVVYSHDITAFIGYLRTKCNLSVEKTEHLFRDILGLSISKGTIENKTMELAEKAIPLYQKILELLKKSNYIGCDETFMKISGIRAFEWVFQNKKLCYYVASFSRGFNVIQETIGDFFDGIWGCDRYTAQLAIRALHQYCLAHITRECRFLEQSHDCRWATSFKQLLKDASELHKNPCFNPKHPYFVQEIKILKQRLLMILAHPPPKNKMGKLKTISDKEKEILRFLNYCDIPPDNNGSERALRPVAIKRKTGGFRTFDGAQRYSIILSVIETCKKQGKHILLTLSRILDNNEILLQS